MFKCFDFGEKCLVRNVYASSTEAILKVYSHVFEFLFISFQPEKTFTWFDGGVTHCLNIPPGLATKYAPLLLPLGVATTYAPLLTTSSPTGLRFVFTGQEQCPIVQLTPPEDVVEVKLRIAYTFPLRLLQLKYDF